MRKRVHSDFKKAFQSGAVLTGGDAPCRMRQFEIGDLSLPSGKISVCDPSLGSTVLGKVKPGVYPVTLAMARIGQQKGKIVACAKVSFSRKEAIRWKWASGLNVETGLACFVDSRAAKQLEQRSSEILPRKRQPGSLIQLDMETGANVAIFGAGYGDGGYPIWWGADCNGKRASLVVDFGILLVPQEREVIIANPSSFMGANIEHPHLKAAKINIFMRRRPATKHVIEFFHLQYGPYIEYEFLDCNNKAMSILGGSYGCDVDGKRYSLQTFDLPQKRLKRYKLRVRYQVAPKPMA